MPTISYSKLPPSYTRGVHVYQWSGMGAGDDGLPAIGVSKFTKKTVEASGTVTSVPIQGRVDGGAWVTLATLTAAGIMDIPQGVDDIRPLVTTGSGVGIILSVVSPSRGLVGETSVGGLTPLPGGGFSFPTGQILAPDGAVNLPSYSFVNSPDTGWFRTAAGMLVAVKDTDAVGGSWIAIGAANGIGLRAGVPIGWSSTIDATLTPILQILADAADIFAQRRALNPQTLRLYNTWTDASNGEWLALKWVGNDVIFTTERNGTGVGRNLLLRTTTGIIQIMPTGAGAAWNFQADSTASMVPSSPNASDIGSSAAAIRSLYVGTKLDFVVPTVPGTPGAGHGVLYMKADKKLYFKDDAGVETALW